MFISSVFFSTGIGSDMLLLKWYRQPGLGGESEHAALWEKLASVVGPQLSSLRTELCFYVQLEDGAAGS